MVAFVALAKARTQIAEYLRWPVSGDRPTTRHSRIASEALDRKRTGITRVRPVVRPLVPRGRRAHVLRFGPVALIPYDDLTVANVGVQNRHKKSLVQRQRGFGFSLLLGYFLGYLWLPAGDLLALLVVPDRTDFRSFALC